MKGELVSPEVALVREDEGWNPTKPPGPALVTPAGACPVNCPRSVKKMCRRHIFSAGRSGYAARREVDVLGKNRFYLVCTLQGRNPAEFPVQEIFNRLRPGGHVSWAFRCKIAIKCRELCATAL